MSDFSENPWEVGNCCEGHFHQDVAHILDACQYPHEAFDFLCQTELFKYGEALFQTVSEARMRFRSVDSAVCRDFYMLCEDVDGKEALDSFLRDMGVLEYIREIDPDRAGQIERALA